MNFKDYIKEESKPDTIVVLNGRMNPITKGHEENVNGMKKFAKKHNADHLLIASHSHDSKKNPLTAEQKLKHLHRAFPDTNIKVSNKEEPTIFHQLSNIHKQGYKHVVLASGADRTEDYDRIKDYNGKTGKHGFYHFKSITTESTGERKEGVSGTDMRNHATNNDFKSFKKGLPSKLAADNSHAKDIFNDVRHGLKQNVKEEFDREAYLNEEIFRLNDIVTATNGDTGPIVYRGSTYVTMQLREGKTVKHWLTDISEVGTALIAPKPERKVMEQKIPALLMTKKQLQEMHNKSMELTYNGYTTHNLHMCPSASEQLKELIKSTDKNPKYILQAIQASDEYLGIEKMAKEKGFADEEMVHNFNMKLAIAHDTLNMLGYSDKLLTYMTGHIKTMSDLHMHADGTFANETMNTVPTFGAEDTSEGYNSADYRIVIGKDGKKYKVRANQIIRDADGDGKPDGSKQVKETITMSKLRKKMSETYAPDPATVHRDVNLTGDKEVYHGIDKTIEGQGHEDKPVGLVSFKTFFTTPETQKIEQDKGAEMQDVHRSKAELAVHSTAYKMMKKSKQQLDV